MADLQIAESARGRATFSPCGRFRYRLERYLTPRDELARRRRRERIVTFVMLNPSTADAFRDDRTIAKCSKYARAWGGDTLCVVNLFALRATDPRELARRSCAEEAGADAANELAIRDAAARAAIVIAAWGNHGARWDRGALVLRGALAGISLHHLGLSQRGQPMHPLYRPDATAPVAMPLARVGSARAMRSTASTSSDSVHAAKPRRR